MLACNENIKGENLAQLLDLNKILLKVGQRVVSDLSASPKRYIITSNYPRAQVTMCKGNIFLWHANSKSKTPSHIIQYCGTVGE